jgi:hypothetical protein
MVAESRFDNISNVRRSSGNDSLKMTCRRVNSSTGSVRAIGSRSKRNDEISNWVLVEIGALHFTVVLPLFISPDGNAGGSNPLFWCELTVFGSARWIPIILGLAQDTFRKLLFAKYPSGSRRATDIKWSIDGVTVFIHIR